MEDTAYTLYQDGPGGRELRLEVLPVVTLTSLTDDTTLDFTSSSYLVASGDYALVDGSRGLVRLLTSSAHGEWSKKADAIKAVYTAGWVTIPPKLKRLCAEQVAYMWGRRTTQGKASVSQAGNSVTYTEEAEIPPAILVGLARYFLPRRMA